MIQTIESIRRVMHRVEFPGYAWDVIGEEGRMYLQATFQAPDCKGRGMCVQHTRKWYISRDSTDSEIVRTAFKCVQTSLEHEAREAFKYRGQPIFGPHMDVDRLHAMCAAGDFEDRRVEATP